jgi:hypothetical protein
MGNDARYVQEINKQSNQSCVACEPVESNFSHICPNNPILTCNCTDPKYCAELGSDPDRQHRDSEPNKDGFADNIDYTGIPIPTSKGQSTISGWPCVVVGAVCETWVSTAKRILRATAGEWDTKQHIDAGLSNDGSAATTKL